MEVLQEFRRDITRDVRTFFWRPGLWSARWATAKQATRISGLCL